MRETVRKIPRGRVSSYGQVARAAGFPRAARQVAWALNESTGLPWHRVVGAEGKILLRGETAWEQRLRLENEGVRFRGKCVRMDLHEHLFDGRKRRPAAGRRRAQK